MGKYDEITSEIEEIITDAIYNGKECSGAGESEFVQEIAKDYTDRILKLIKTFYRRNK